MFVFLFLSPRRGGDNTLLRRGGAAVGQESSSSKRARQRNCRLLTGTSAAGGLAAAKKTVKKAVFYIDNVYISYNPSDVQSYVSNFPVNVLSCFSAKPRRRRNENEPVTDRKAFRLCIAAEDRDKLFDPAKWPHSVAISVWYHLSPSTNRQSSDTEGQTGATGVTVSGSSPDARETALTMLLSLTLLSLLRCLAIKTQWRWRMTTLY